MRRPLPLLLILPVCLFVLVSGCSRDASQHPSATASAPITADPSATDDVPGAMACKALAVAVRDATLMNPGVVEALVAASTSADAPIADSAHRLATAYAKAVRAKGTDNEPDAVAAVSVAGAEMFQVCDESGFETVG